MGGGEHGEALIDIVLPEEARAFRREVRAFFAENLPVSTRRTLELGRKPDRAALTEWTRILHAKGWAVPHWPVEWGGTGWSPLWQMIFRDETQQFPAPEALSFGVQMVGPVIYTFGSEAQKRRFLPRIATLDDWWCQGFSEPGAGSDLASLRTRATRDGDDWVLDGQKTWTTLAQYADWIFVLARTDPEARKQAGISFFLVNLRSPGVTVRPIRMIDGSVEINEIFFDSVRVPGDQLVGEVNRGWDYAKFLLGNERHGQARVGLSKGRLRHVRRLAATLPDGDGVLIDNPSFRRRLAALEAEAVALEVTLIRIMMEEAGEHTKPNPATSILKIRGSELYQATAGLVMEALGPDALYAIAAPEDHGLEALAGGTDLYVNLRKLSIYGGSNEIQRSIIAKAILGL